MGELRQAEVRQSFGARFARYRQVIGGLPVLGSDTVVTDGRGRAGNLVVEGTRRARRVPARATLARANAVRTARQAAGVTALRGPIAAGQAILVTGAGPRTVWRVVVPSGQPLGSFEVLVDARDGSVLRIRDLLRRAFTATGQGSVFDSNPIVAQGSRGALADAGDSDSATLTALREEVALARLDTDSPGCLEGQWAHATIPAGEVCDNPGRDFAALTRDDGEFEAVMAYFHIDRAQEYIRSLGFDDVRAVQQRVRANEVFVDEDDDPLPPAEQDNSFYDSLNGEISLGTGGTDDGEDGEVIVHEYGHAIQDDQVPGWGASDEGGAMGEGFGDYLAAAISATFAPSATFDPCVAEWDELGFGNPAAVPCLRRVDGSPTASDVGPGTDCNGEVHCAGEAWSGALWEIRAEIGGQTADRVVIQSHFSLTPAAGFHEGAQALLAADATLYGGVHVAFMRDLLAARGLLDIERLDDAPAGARPLTLPGDAAGTLAAGDDDHDVYALNLTAGRSVLLRLSGPGGEYDLRLLRPGATSVDDPGASVAASETTGPNETLSFTPGQSGVHYVDVVAIAGGGPYALAARLDGDGDLADDGQDNCPAVANSDQADGDRDGIGDACDRFPVDPVNDRDRDRIAADEDNCPAVANRGQRDWDGDGRGDVCDRSARVKLGRARRDGRRVRVIATLRPDLLGPRAVKLGVQRRVCAPRCSWRSARVSVSARRVGRGRVQLRLRLADGDYRLRARLVDRRYAKARSRAVTVPRP
ncbi:MAG TPA: thrombospondin type 3 repeat-containing protein [Thermoleophilaceae bacterium]|nr:thrombospondin type 3 repeat-containing protein [Thermoleophilaceae bacterium]